MIKHLLILYCILGFITVNAQEPGIAIYKKEWINRYSESKAGQQDKISNPQKYREYRKLEEIQQKLTKQLEYTLKFDKNESLFYLEDLLNINDQADLALAKEPYQGEYYYNRAVNSIIWTIEALGEKFLVNLDKIDWKLEKERKTISGYSCFKASAKKASKNAEFQDVIAWYTPELPLSYGPLHYNGLPGLVVQLETHSERFTLSGIQQKPVKIKAPEKGTSISESDFFKQFQNFKL